MKLSISLPIDLNDELVKYSEQTGLNRSVVIQLALRDYLKAQQMMKDMPTLMEEMAKAIKAGKEFEKGER